MDRPAGPPTATPATARTHEPWFQPLGGAPNPARTIPGQGGPRPAVPAPPAAAPPAPPSADAESASAAPVQILTVGDVLHRLRERWPLAVAPVLIGLLVSIGYVVVTPPSYVATAAVVVQPVVADQFGTINLSTVINMSTEAQVAKSSAVAARAGQKLGLEAGVVRDSFTVDSPQDTQVLNIHFVAGTADGAAAGAQTVAESYLAYREGSVQEDADRRLESIATQIEAIRQVIVDGGQATAYQETLRALLTDQRVLTSVKATSGGRVITRAVPPRDRATPRPAVDLAIGIAAGAVVGLVLSVAWPRARRAGRRSRHLPPAPGR